MSSDVDYRNIERRDEKKRIHSARLIARNSEFNSFPGSVNYLEALLSASLSSLSIIFWPSG
jgi:hypothetical protein